jgi:signal transduction histidine kinase
LAGTVFLVAFVGGIESIVAVREESWLVTILGWVFIGAASGALVARRRRPVLVAGIVLAATAAYYITSVYDGPLIVALVVALYTVAAEGRLRAAVILTAVSVLAVGAGTLAGNRDVNSVGLLMFSGWLVATVALGWVRHTRRAYADQAQQRAATEERLRIARELHDVVGHHISLISVQSAAALHRIRKDPAQAESALGAIKESSRQALRELRATLGVLRGADQSAAPVTPAAGLARIGELVESAELAGLTVRSRTSGGAGQLPTEIDLAAYRIVQESLTNVARHSGATAVTVNISRAPREVTVEVADNGRGSAPATGGSGIHGMRERARALGGELTAGPRPGGGFVVSARLPHEAATPA